MPPSRTKTWSPHLLQRQCCLILFVCTPTFQGETTHVMRSPYQSLRTYLRSCLTLRCYCTLSTIHPEWKSLDYSHLLTCSHHMTCINPTRLCNQCISLGYILYLVFSAIMAAQGVYTLGPRKIFFFLSFSRFSLNKRVEP